MIERRVNWNTASWLLWRLEREGRDIQCIVALEPNGFQARYVCNGQLLFEHMFSSWKDASKWARERRCDLESQGWMSEAGTLSQRAS